TGANRGGTLRKLIPAILFAAACSAEAPVVGEEENSTDGVSINVHPDLSGCHGHAPSTIPANHSYNITTFGGGADTQPMSCGGTGGGSGSGSGSGGGGGASCSSSTLDRDVDDGTCVQSASDASWYQCDNGSWTAISSTSGCSQSFAWCNSATLGKSVPPRTCVQAASNSVWYQCNGQSWVKPVDTAAE